MYNLDEINRSQFLQGALNNRLQKGFMKTNCINTNSYREA